MQGCLKKKVKCSVTFCLKCMDWKLKICKVMLRSCVYTVRKQIVQNDEIVCDVFCCFVLF